MTLDNLDFQAVFRPQRGRREARDAGPDHENVRLFFTDFGTATSCHHVDYDDCAEADIPVCIPRRKQCRLAPSATSREHFPCFAHVIKGYTSWVFGPRLSRRGSPSPLSCGPGFPSGRCRTSHHTLAREKPI